MCVCSSQERGGVYFHCLLHPIGVVNLTICLLLVQLVCMDGVMFARSSARKLESLEDENSCAWIEIELSNVENQLCTFVCV